MNDTVRLDAPGRLVHAAAADPAPPGPDETLVAVHRVGVCGTDLHAFAGRQPFFSYPRVLGHELGVEVLTCGDGSLAPGTTCTVVPYLPCGRCVACRRDRPNCCEHLEVLGVHRDGGMRERFVVPTAALLPATGLSLDQLALTETLAIGAHAVARALPEPGDRALVVGAGPIGLGAAVRLRAAGVPVVVLDQSPERLALARDRFDLTSTVTAGEGENERLRAACDGELPTLLIDATGAPASMDRAVGRTASSGRIVFVGLHRQAVSFPDAEFHRKELTLLASRNARATDFATVLDDLRRGRVDAGAFITHRTGLEAIGDDLPRFADPARGVVKAMLEIGS